MGQPASPVGNPALTRLLVEAARTSLPAASSVAILACSIVNVCLGDRWLFAAGGQLIPRQTSPSALTTAPLAISAREDDRPA